MRKLATTSIPRQVARTIDRSPAITDLFVGNSLVAAGFEAEPFERARPGRRALNIGLGFSSPVEHDILLRRALSKLSPERVYYGFFDTQLFEPMPSGWGDLVGNRAMAYYMDLETAIRFYAAGDPLRAELMRLAARVPIVVERNAISGRVEKLRRRLGAIGLPPQRTNRFGRAGDFRALEFSNEADFLQNCRSAVDLRKKLLPPVADMLRLCRERGIAVVVVEMPMTTRHRHRFCDHPEWTRLRHDLAQQSLAAGATYLDASDWVDDAGFADDLHLNAASAAEFSAGVATGGARAQTVCALGKGVGLSVGAIPTRQPVRSSR